MEKMKLHGDIDDLIMIQTDRLLLKDILKRMEEDKRISNEIKEDYFSEVRLKSEECLRVIGGGGIDKIVFLSKLEKELDKM